MLANNKERLDIWLLLNNRFDYSEFVAACTSAGVAPLSGMEFAQKAGTVQAGIIENPELAPDAAYLLYLKNHQSVVHGQAPQSTVPNTVTAYEAKPCASCGGGTVR